MTFYADFHIHSHYSRATSKKLTPEYLDYYAGIKGIGVLGTGDLTHPGWLEELEEKLIRTEDGLYILKDSFKVDKNSRSPAAQFILTGEISNIYKKNDNVRKVHNLVFAPDFETAHKIQQKLSHLDFNITSDGRPILGLDSRDLLDLLLNISSRIFLVPAHIWTPWFSMLGDKSGFDSVEECYGDLSQYIYAVETGLSSDPPMNRLCSFLDKYTLISNSDAHSPDKLGRNANILNCGYSYEEIIGALKSGDPAQFTGTVELYPQQGKYHFDGHRKCRICLNPLETLKNKGLCPSCGKKVTVGVLNRVLKISDREKPFIDQDHPAINYTIPLKEILSEILGTGESSKRVQTAYDSIIEKSGNELDLLLKLPLEELEHCGLPHLAEAVKRMREGRILIREGFDGEYGRIKLFKDEELKTAKVSDSLFRDFMEENISIPGKRKIFHFDLAEYRSLSDQANTPADPPAKAAVKKKKETRAQYPRSEN